MVWTRTQAIASTPGISLHNFWNHRLHCHWLISKIRCSIIILTTIRHRCTLFFFFINTILKNDNALFRCLSPPLPQSHFHFHLQNENQYSIFGTIRLKLEKLITHIYLINSGLIRSFQFPVFCYLLGTFPK